MAPHPPRSRRNGSPYDGDHDLYVTNRDAVVAAIDDVATRAGGR